MIKKALIVMLVLLAFVACIPKHWMMAEAALTSVDVAGTYDVQINTFDGGEKPLMNAGVITFQPTGVWMIMCSQTIGAEIYSYPCSFAAWSIDSDDNIIPQYDVPFICKQLSPGVLWCYVPGQFADIVMVRQAEAPPAQ